MQESYLALGVVALVGIAAFAALRGVSIPAIGTVVFLAVALWTGQFFLTDATLLLDPVLESVFWALAVTIPVTVVGISLGRLVRARVDEEWEATRLDDLLTGQSSKVAIGWITVGAISFILTFVFLSMSNAQGFLAGVPGGSLSTYLIGSLLIGLPAVYQSFRNEGLLISWVLSFGLPYALLLDGFLASNSEPPLVDMIYAGAIALGVAIVLGTFWFAVGVGLKRLAGGNSGVSSEESRAV